MENTNVKKASPIKIIVIVLLIIGTIVGFIFYPYIYGENSIFNKYVSDNELLQFLYGKITAVIQSLQTITVAYVLYLLVKIIMQKSVAKSKRGITVTKLLTSFIKWIVFIATILIVLGIWGVDTTTLIASAGVMSLIVGLGAQSLVADIIAGLFIVVEGEYQVGDIVVIDGWRGTVSEIGIRTTKIVDAGGNIKIVNNSEITTIVNQTQALSVAKTTMCIEYNENLERVEQIINNNLENIKNNIPAIIEGPFYKGVSALSASSVDLLIIAKCNEEDIFQVQRDLNREFKMLFDKNDINIPFPQIVVNNRKEK